MYIFNIEYYLATKKEGAINTHYDMDKPKKEKKKKKECAMWKKPDTKSYILYKFH